MSISLYINGVDKSSNILWETLQWEQAINNEVDTVMFSYRTFTGRSFAPAMFDEVKLYDAGVLVFGGHIIEAKKQMYGYDAEIVEVVVKDYSHKMDARLVAETYEGVPALNIICDILNKYINKNMRVEMATFNVDEVWSAGTADTTVNHFRVGTQGLKLTSTGTTTTAARLLYLDLTQNSLGTSDYIDVDVYVDDVSKLSSLVIKLGDLNLSNYFYADVTSQITKSGSNLVHILKSAFSSSGSPSWSGIYQLQLEVDATGSDTVNVTFSNMQCISATAYTRNAAAGAEQIVQYLRFNYEPPSKCIQQVADLFSWQWYVDENRDIHLFALYGESSPFNLTDTNGYYVPRSLQIRETVDQLRNSIFVRGSDYLDSSVTEDLRHQVDGNNKVFKLGYKYDMDTMTVTLQSNTVSVGLDNVDAISNNQGAAQTLTGATAQKVGDNAARTYADQQIIQTKFGRLAKIKLRVRKVGTPADNFTVQIFSDDGTNKPTTSSLSAAATLAGGSMSTSFAEYSFTLSESATNSMLFSKNTKFHVRITRSGAVDASNYYEVDMGTAAYDGIAYYGNATPVWTSINTKLYFVCVTGYEALYSPDTRILAFNTAPSAGNTLTIAGQPYKPVFVQYKDNVSIAEFGEYQQKITDLTIKTKEGARQRALQEVLAWSAEADEASFTTYSSGLRVGQTINVQSSIHGIDTDFLVSRVVASARTHEAFEYHVELITTKTFGILYWLQAQILASDKNVLIDDTESLDKLEDFSEQITFTDTDVDTTLYTGHVWSNDAGTTPDKLVWQGADTTMYWA